MEVYIVTKSEMHSDCIVGVYKSKEDAQKSAEKRDKEDKNANYYVESHVVIGASDRVERMKLEKAELEQRITELLALHKGEEFGKLDDTEKRLLRMQYAGMDTYLTALGSRLVHEDMKRYQCEIQALSKQIPDLKAQGKTDEEIAKILAEKSMSIPTFSFDLHNMLPILIHGQMLCGKNSEPATAAK